MKKQRDQIIILVVLIILWGVSWHYNKLPSTPPSVIKTNAAAKTGQDNLLRTRFHTIRAEMDGLYHYRVKPVAFVIKGNPFRIPPGMVLSASGRPEKPAADPSKASTDAPPPSPSEPVEVGERLLRHAVALSKIGGVVTMNNTTELTVNGELHKEGEVFAVRVHSKLVLIRIKRLSESAVSFALDDPESGTAEIRVRLK